ncbi:MAG: replication initiation protein [Methylococcaceae bacterium]
MATIKKKSLPSSLIVTQSNKLVEARYNLPLGEQRLILTMISKIQLDDEDFKEYRINVGEFAEFLGIDKNSIYREFHKIQKSIVSRVLVFYESDGPLVVGWVSSAKYLEKEGAVLLSFDPKLKPYLLQLKGNFTSSKLEMLVSFKSQYTMRIYNLLKQYKNIQVREIEVELLREMLGLRNDQYKKYNDFKKNILELTQKELKSKADLYFEFDEIKYGRKVGAIRFRILTKKDINPSDDNAIEHVAFDSSEASSASSVDALLSLVLEQHRAKKTVQAAIAAYEKKHDFEYVKRNILYSNDKAEKSYAGYLNNALKSDWGHDWALDQNKVSVKKKVIEIWERQGFSSEKEYNESRYSKQMEAYGHKV